MARNLPLIFALVLAGGLLVDHGVKLFGQTFGGSDPAVAFPSDQSTGSAPGGAAGAAGVTAGGATGRLGDVTPQMLAHEAHAHGWNPTQVQAWRELIGIESGGRAGAINPTSKAWGIGQFLGATLTEYADRGAASVLPGPQLHAMGLYIADRYGDPVAALAHEHANRWY